jgi:GT2 family glycosyltransferase
MKPWLSVVMPVHNPNHWLGDALASIVAQDEPKGAIEVIVRDSSPGGPAGEADARRYAKSLDIDYVHTPDVLSWTRKTNIMVRAARARHVCTLHQDDLWLAGRAQHMREQIAAYADAALVFCPSRLIDAVGRDLGGWNPPFRAGPVPGDQFRQTLLVQNSIAMPAPIFRRDAYLSAGGLDEDLWYTPDWDLWLKLADQGAVVFDLFAATAFRIHSGAQTMTRSRSEFAEQLGLVLARHMRPGDSTAQLGRASVAVNVALAEAAAGQSYAALKALLALVRLGPVGAWQYLRLSRLLERLWPRLRLRFAGGL